MSTWKNVCLVLGAICTMAIPGYSGERSPKPSFVLRLSADRKLPFEYGSSAMSTLAFNKAVMGQLIAIENHFEPKPSIIRSFYWDYAKHGYVLELDKTLQFHNGRSVTIEDLEFSLVRPFHLTKTLDSYLVLQWIEGIKNIAPGSPYKPWSVAGIQKLDDSKILVKLSRFDPRFLLSLAQTTISLIPREELEDDLLTWKTWPIGVGPYRVSGLNAANSEVTISYNGHDEQRKGSSIQFTSNPDSDADVIGYTANKPDSADYARYISKRTVGIIAIVFHYHTKLGGKLAFRRSIQRALYQTQFFSKRDDFMPTRTIIPTSLWRALGYDEDAVAKDEHSDQSEQSLDKHVAFGVPAYNMPRKDTNASIFAEIEQQLAKARIQANIYTDNQKYFTNADAPPMRLVTFITDYTDPMVLLSAFAPGGPNVNAYPDDDLEYQKILSGIRACQNKEDVTLGIKKGLRHFYKHAYAVPLLEVKASFWYKKSSITAIGDADDAFFDVEKVKWTK